MLVRDEKRVCVLSEYGQVRCDPVDNPTVHAWCAWVKLLTRFSPSGGRGHSHGGEPACRFGSPLCWMTAANLPACSRSVSPDHGAVHRARRSRHTCAMTRGSETRQAEATQGASPHVRRGRHGAPMTQRAYGTSRLPPHAPPNPTCPTESHRVPAIPPNPTESRLSHRIPLNPGESRTGQEPG